jgi:hypothetical protein
LTIAVITSEKLGRGCTGPSFVPYGAVACNENKINRIMAELIIRPDFCQSIIGKSRAGNSSENNSGFGSLFSPLEDWNLDTLNYILDNNQHAW